MEKLKSLLLLTVFISAVNCFFTQPISGSPLYLTSYIERGAIAEGKNLAKVNYPDLTAKGISSYSGFLTVNKTYNSNLFFWFFQAKQNPANAPVVVWLQGGKQRETILC